MEHHGHGDVRLAVCEPECDEVDAEIWRAGIASSSEHGGVGFYYDEVLSFWVVIKMPSVRPGSKMRMHQGFRGWCGCRQRVAEDGRKQEV